MRRMAGYADLCQGGMEQRPETAGGHRKQAVPILDERDDLPVERDDTVLSGSSLHAAAEEPFFHVDLQFPVSGDPETAVYHDEHCLQHFIPVCVFPDEGKLLLREGLPFFVIVGSVDPDMVRVFPVALVVGEGIVIHLPEKIQDVLFRGMFFRAVVDH